MAYSGRLRHQVAWANRQGDDQGSTRAHVRGTTANEAEIAGLDTGLVGVAIRMRAHPEIRPGPGWTATHGERQYSVKGSYDPTGKGREFVVVAVDAV